MVIPEETRARLRAVKLASMVRAGGGEPESAPAFALGAAVRSGEGTWLLLTEDPRHAVGPALAFARKHDLDRLHLVVDLGIPTAEAEAVARRAAAFATEIRVLRADPNGPLPVAVAAPPVTDEVPSPEAELFAALFADVGLDFVLEHGIVTAEWLGLEVARLVSDDPSGLHLRVGIGQLDQDAGELVNAHLSDADALDRVAALARLHRRADAAPGPINQLVPERWLRRVLQQHPTLVGCAELRPVAPVPGRRNLRERGVAPLIGLDSAGHEVVVACSVGVDLDAVPGAADARSAHAGPDTRLVIAVPQSDLHPMTEALAGELTWPAEVCPIAGDWKALPVDGGGSIAGTTARG